MIKTIKIDIDKISGEERKQKAIRSSQKLLEIYQSDLFMQLVLNMDRDKWLRGESSNSSFIGLSNRQIYEKLMTGQEEWNGELDYEIDLILSGYWGKKWSKVVGFMNPGQPTINMNYRFFDGYDEKRVASNMGHEHTHTCGSRHSGPYLKESIPYFMNWVIETVYDSLEDGELPPPRPVVKYRQVCYRSWKTLYLFKTCKRVAIVE